MRSFLLKSTALLLAMLFLVPVSFAAQISGQQTITTDEKLAVTSFEENEIYQSVASLSELDDFLASHSGMSYDQVVQVDKKKTKGISDTASVPYHDREGVELALGIPSFFWGCGFGLVGMVIVYMMTDENKAETQKAFWGCVTASVTGTVLYLVLVAIIAASSPTYDMGYMH